MVFATHPVVVRIGGADYVRAIQKVHPGRQPHLLLRHRRGSGADARRQRRHGARTWRRSSGSPRARWASRSCVIGCDCILRKLEMERRSITEPRRRPARRTTR